MLSVFIFIKGPHRGFEFSPELRTKTERKHLAFQRNVYNRLLFDCLQVAVDVIFAAVSNQCPQETVVREALPTLNVAVEGLTEVTN